MENRLRNDFGHDLEYDSIEQQLEKMLDSPKAGMDDSKEHDQIKENMSKNISSPKPGTSNVNYSDHNYLEKRKVSPLKICIPKPQINVENNKPKQKRKRKSETDFSNNQDTNITKKPRKSNVSRVKCKKCGQRVYASKFMLHYMPHFDDNGFEQPGMNIFHFF